MGCMTTTNKFVDRRRYWIVIGGSTLHLYPRESGIILGSIFITAGDMCLMFSVEVMFKFDSSDV